MTAVTPPPALAGDLRNLTASELSRPSRAGHVALLLVASAMTIVVSALLLTEPALPRRTAVALSVLAVIGASWVAFAAWVLTRRRVLFGSHRVVAGRMAVAFCAVFVAGAVLVGFSTASTAAFAATGLGVGMLLVAVILLTRATRALDKLSRRREVLERELARERS
jgi:hypothetical protein